MTFDWSEHVDEWYIREHSTQRNGNEWRNDRLGYKIQYRGHRTSYRWCVVIDDNDNFVLSPKKSRFWDGGHSDVMFEVTKMEHEKTNDRHAGYDRLGDIHEIEIDGTHTIEDVQEEMTNLRGHYDGFIVRNSETGAVWFERDYSNATDGTYRQTNAPHATYRTNRPYRGQEE